MSMTTNRVKRMFEDKAYTLQDQQQSVIDENRETRNGTYEIIEGHSAFDDHRCELCGAEVHRNGDAKVQYSTTEAKLAVEAISAMCRWSIYSPRLLLVMAHKIETPSITVRELAHQLGIGKTQADEYIKEVCGIFPMLAPVLGLSTPKARAQQERRANA